MRKFNIYDEEMEVELEEINHYEVEYMESEDAKDYIEEYGLQDWADELVRN